MIHYQLRCGSAHHFDGWFRDSAAFDGQAKHGLLACPICGSSGVTRAIMAPAVGSGRKAPVQVAETAVAAPKFEPTPSDTTKSDPAQPLAKPPVAVGGMPDQVRAMLQRMRAEVEKRCDYVGPAFATEARKIHDGETPPRPIYGEATPDEAKRLADDGIEVSQIPWVSRADS